MNNVEINFRMDYSLLQLAVFMAMLMLLSHWLACGWYASRF